MLHMYIQSQWRKVREYLSNIDFRCNDINLNQRWTWMRMESHQHFVLFASGGGTVARSEAGGRGAKFTAGERVNRRRTLQDHMRGRSRHQQQCRGALSAHEKSSRGTGELHQALFIYSCSRAYPWRLCSVNLHRWSLCSVSRTRSKLI